MYLYIYCITSEERGSITTGRGTWYRPQRWDVSDNELSHRLIWCPGTPIALCKTHAIAMNVIRQKHDRRNPHHYPLHIDAPCDIMPFTERSLSSGYRLIAEDIVILARTFTSEEDQTRLAVEMLLIASD